MRSALPAGLPFRAKESGPVAFLPSRSGDPVAPTPIRKRHQTDSSFDVYKASQPHENGVSVSMGQHGSRNDRIKAFLVQGKRRLPQNSTIGVITFCTVTVSWLPRVRFHRGDSFFGTQGGMPRQSSSDAGVTCGKACHIAASLDRGNAGIVGGACTW
ncbi:hypothetical protein GV68_25005 [Pseudorhizobium pelagicum]|uniref:Uncharacterized protein n=1 Tax=Pseudorhizobium pelagicum TaxID=1509405 RepID=A0A922T7T0_9HYPH|nr:hypothetical protein GV68_25005 [Pseudorhizobium pelagicum]